MKAEPAHAFPAGPEPTSVPDDRERVIESLSQLLSSGRPLSEVLDEARRLADSSSSDSFRCEPNIASAKPAGSGGMFRSPSLARLLPVWLVPTIGLAALATAAGIEVIANLPMNADASSAVPAIISKPTAQSSKGMTAPSDQSVSVVEVAALLARGDALLSMSDVSSGRLFYQRAVAAGNAQAALRLGASYDASFLSRVGIRGVRGDPALASYWYERARDLGAVETAEALLKSLKN